MSYVELKPEAQKATRLCSYRIYPPMIYNGFEKPAELHCKFSKKN